MTVLEDIRELERLLREVDTLCKTNAAVTSRLEEKVSGERGLATAIDSLGVEVKSLRRAAYWVAGLIVAGAISLAFSVLTVFGG